MDGAGAQSRLPARAELLPRTQLRPGPGGRQRHCRRPSRRRGSIIRFCYGCRRLARRGRQQRCRRRVRDGSEHAARRDGRSGRGEWQARVLREAGRRHTCTDRRRRTGRPAGRCDLGGRLQLSLGATCPVRQATRRQRRARRHHELLRAFLLDVRIRSARRAVVAVPRRPGGPWRVDRHPQPLRRPRPLPDRRRRRADHPRRGYRRDLHQAASAAHRSRYALRPRTTRRPDRRGHQRGLHRHDVRVRQRCPRHVRGVPFDGRSGEPEPVRDLRHAGFDAVELRADEPAAGVHRRRSRAYRIRQRVRRRPLSSPRQLRARFGERDRLRRPGVHRGPRVPRRRSRPVGSMSQGSPKRSPTSASRTPSCAVGSPASGKTFTR